MREEGVTIGYPKFDSWQPLDDEYEVTLFAADEPGQVRLRRFGNPEGDELACFDCDAPIFERWIPAGGLIEVTARLDDHAGTLRVRRKQAGA